MSVKRKRRVLAIDDEPSMTEWLKILLEHAGYEVRTALIGTRGVRLSGGQVQRAAAARAFVHRPELLVLDDLASALDVDTEIALWDRLTAAGCTILTATNRPTALQRADRIIRLEAPQ